MEEQDRRGNGNRIAQDTNLVQVAIEASAWQQGQAAEVKSLVLSLSAVPISATQMKMSVAEKTDRIS